MELCGSFRSLSVWSTMLCFYSIISSSRHADTVCKAAHSSSTVGSLHSNWNNSQTADVSTQIQMNDRVYLFASLWVIMCCVFSCSLIVLRRFNGVEVTADSLCSASLWACPVFNLCYYSLFLVCKTWPLAADLSVCDRSHASKAGAFTSTHS